MNVHIYWQLDLEYYSGSAEKLESKYILGRLTIPPKVYDAVMIEISSKETEEQRKIHDFMRKVDAPR